MGGRWGNLSRESRMRTPLTKAEYVALAGLRHALRQFLRFSEEAALDAGLTPQQHQALLAIKGFPDRDCVTVGELADRLQIRHHSAVGLVDRLVGQGLAARRQPAEDRRRVNVTLTARGEAILERLSTAHREQLRRLGPEIDGLLHRLRGQNAAPAPEHRRADSTASRRTPSRRSPRRSPRS